MLLIVLLTALMLKTIDRQRRAVNFDIRGFLDGYKHTAKIDTSRAVVQAPAKMYRSNIPQVKNSGGKLNINMAGVEQLQKLPGLGPVLAHRIVAFRDSAGLFHSAEDLLKIDGIGPKKLALIAGHIEF